MPLQDPLELVRPFLWIAAFAFLVGFSAYALVGSRHLLRGPDGAGPVTTSSAESTPWADTAILRNRIARAGLLS